jgi:Ca-activated chloride channel homolog
MPRSLPFLSAVALVGACALNLVMTQPAHADGFIVIPEPPPRRIRPIRPRPPRLIRGFPLAVEHHDVKVTIKGQIATTEVDQIFRNPTNRRLEGLYVFPLPPDAALDQFSMWIDGKEMQGEVLDKDKALGIYEGIVRKLQDPALLEYAGRGLFKVRIFPIEPMGKKRVKLTYRQTLKRDSGRVRYRYPLNTEKFSSEPLQRASISVSIESDEPIKGIYSPWHKVDVRRTSETKAVASWEAVNAKPSRDFVLDYDLARGQIGASVRCHAEPAREGTFMLTLSPQVEVSQRIEKDVVFVVDTSGTMATDGKMEQAQKALQYMIAKLDPSDRFAVVDFATDARVYKDELVAGSAEEKAGATHYVKGLKARGGTAIDEALGRACKFRGADTTRPFVVVFMTDGEPTIGEREPDRILENLKKVSQGKAARVFVWGVGNDLNANLLDRIASQQRGDSYYVLPGENIEVSMSSFYDKISHPVLTDLSVSIEGVRTSEIYPRQIPDLFHGGQLLLLGRFKGEGHAAIRVKGKVNGKDKEFVFEGAFKRSTNNVHIPRLWAKRKIGYLLEEIRKGGATNELKQEVVRLARRHGLPTPYTSYLVLEEGALTGGPRRQPAAPGDRAAQNALRRLREGAKRKAGESEEDKDGFAGGGGQAAAPSGKEAVRGSRLAGRLKRADRADLGETLDLERDVIEDAIRQVAGRTFYRNGEVWVHSEVGKRGADWVSVDYMSEAYFKLVKELPGLGAFLSLGKVIVKFEGKTYEIK